MDKLPPAENHVENHQVAAPNGIDSEAQPNKLMRFYSHPWTQILLISFICFCLPGVCCGLIIGVFFFLPFLVLRANMSYRCIMP